MIFGHLAIVGIAKLTSFQRENLVIMTLASFGPDILDKPANILLGMPGRGISHSLVAFAVIATIAGIYWLRVNRNPRLLAGVTTMWGCHIAGDFLQWDVLLWPFVGSLGSGSQFQVKDKLLAYYLEFQFPFQLCFEVTCFLVLIGIIIYRMNTWTFPFRLSFQTLNLSSSRIPPSETI